NRRRPFLQRTDSGGTALLRSQTHSRSRGSRLRFLGWFSPDVHTDICRVLLLTALTQAHGDRAAAPPRPRAPSVQQALSARSGGGLAAAWARGVQAGSARVAGCVFEGLRHAGAERDEGRAPGADRTADRRTIR